MKLFKSLFASNSKTEAQKTKQNIAQPDYSEIPQRELESIASTSTDADEAKLAIQNLEYGDCLIQVAQNSSPDLQSAAIRRIAGLINSQSLAASKVLDSFTDNEIITEIAGLTLADELHDCVIGRMDESGLTNLCLGSGSPKLRKSAIRRVETKENLQKIVKHIKGKDKNTFRIAKEKLDKIRSVEKAKEEVKLKAQELCDEAESHAQREFGNEYESRYQRLENRWRQLEGDVDDAHTERFYNAIRACIKKIQQAQEETAKQEAIALAYKNADSDKSEVLLELENFLSNILEIESKDDVNQAKISEALNTFATRWKTLEKIKPATKANKKSFESIFSAITSYADISGKFGTPKSLLTELATDQSEDAIVKLQPLKPLLGQVRKELRGPITSECLNIITQDVQQKNNAAKRQREAITGIQKLLGRGKSAVQGGRIKQAIGIGHTIDEKAQDLILSESLTKQIDDYKNSVEKLIDWQNYAVVPKKEALITKMEALVGTRLQPQSLADKIKQLQTEWKELKQSGSERNEDLWERFNTAAQKAYEPCKEHFGEQANIRLENLEKRKSLVQQLENFYELQDWTNCDWKNVEKILRVARQEWRLYTPTERAATKPVHESFNQILDRIHGKVNEEHSKNKHSKEILIDQAKKLSDINNLDQAIDSLKRLQSQWKSIGNCAHKENEALWKEFRSHCDAIFSKKTSIIEEQKNEREKHAESADKLIDKLSSLSADKNNILERRSEKDQIVEAFNNVGELPNNKFKAIQTKFKKSLSDFERSVSAALRARETSKWNNLFEILVDLNSLKHLSHTRSADFGDKKEEVLASLKDIGSVLPEGLSSTIAKLIETDFEEINDGDSYRELAVYSELKFGLQTPKEDQALRAEIQVRLLQESFGAASVNNKDQELKSISLKWIKACPLEPQAYEAFHQRFINIALAERPKDKDPIAQSIA